MPYNLLVITFQRKKIIQFAWRVGNGTHTGRFLVNTKSQSSTVSKSSHTVSISSTSSVQNPNQSSTHSSVTSLGLISLAELIGTGGRILCFFKKQWAKKLSFDTHITATSTTASILLELQKLITEKVQQWHCSPCHHG